MKKKRNNEEIIERNKKKIYFEVFEIKQVPLGGNTHIDSLASLVASMRTKMKRVILMSIGPSIPLDLKTSTPLMLTSVAIASLSIFRIPHSGDSSHK